jgi:hypothetical protein
MRVYMLLPGPGAQQLATHIGWLVHGTIGGLVAGFHLHYGAELRLSHFGDRGVSVRAAVVGLAVRSRHLRLHRMCEGLPSIEIVKNKLRAFFVRKKAQERLAADAREDRLADLCIATIQGAMLMGKIKRSPQPVEAAVKEALAHLRRYVALSAAKLET